MRQFLYFIFFMFLTQLLWAVDFCSHRGIRGLKPENTLLAFKTALQYPIDCIDMDVVISKDNIPVVYHDLYLNPQITRDAKGQWVKEKKFTIKNLSLKQLKTYNVGQINPNTSYAQQFKQQKPSQIASIPTLEAALIYILKHEKKSILLQIELKTDPSDPASPDYKTLTLAVAKMIHHYGLESRTKIQAFDWRCLTLLKKHYPLIQRAYLTEDNPTPGLNSGLWTDGLKLKDFQSIPRMIHHMGGHYWDAEDVQLTPKNIKEAHDLGLKVCAWTNVEKAHSNHLQLIKKLMHEPIDCIITDNILDLMPIAN